MRIRTAFGAWVAAMGAVACLLGGSAVAQSLDAPTIASVSVKTGTPGTQLTIVGTSFNGATVTFTQRRVGATPITVPAAAVTINTTGTQLTTTVPDGTDVFEGKMASPGGNTISITTPDGAVTTGFTVITDPNATRTHPVIKSIRPLKARAGAAVTIFGTHLSTVKKVWLGGVKTTFKAPSDNRLVVTVPMHAVSGVLSLQWSGGSIKSSKRLTVQAS